MHHLANEFDARLASVSSSRPPLVLEFVAAAILLREFVRSLQVVACPRNFACHFCVAD